MGGARTDLYESTVRQVLASVGFEDEQPGGPPNEDDVSGSIPTDWVELDVPHRIRERGSLVSLQTADAIPARAMMKSLCTAST
jgi:hypothetical protein